jgi:uncharacterized metal-binding protein YceD (DUF177 family)
MVRAMNEPKLAGPWSVPVTVQEIPPTGRRFELKADAPTRAAVAKSAGLRALPRLEATFDVSRREPDGLHVVGNVSATVGQNCVVTLDPIESEIDERVDLVFLPDTAAAIGDGAGKVDLEIGSDDELEPLVGDAIDLGAIATEFLILGIDLYPRKPEAVFQAPPTDDESAHPFAALAKLRKGQAGHEE